MPSKFTGDYTVVIGNEALNNCSLTTKRDAINTARYLKYFRPDEDLWVANEHQNWKRIYTAEKQNDDRFTPSTWWSKLLARVNLSVKQRTQPGRTE
jgi:hypothetical protein